MDGWMDGMVKAPSCGGTWQKMPCGRGITGRVAKVVRYKKGCRYGCQSVLEDGLGTVQKGAEVMSTISGSYDGVRRRDDCSIDHRGGAQNSVHAVVDRRNGKWGDACAKEDTAQTRVS